MVEVHDLVGVAIAPVSKKLAVKTIYQKSRSKPNYSCNRNNMCWKMKKARSQKMFFKPDYCNHVTEGVRLDLIK